MNANDLTATLSALGLDHLGAARLLGVTDRAVRMWISGDRSVPPTAARFLRLLVVRQIAPDEAMAALDG